jgi:hypothetical protein
VAVWFAARPRHRLLISGDDIVGWRRTSRTERALRPSRAIPNIFERNSAIKLIVEPGTGRSSTRIPLVVLFYGYSLAERRA